MRSWTTLRRTAIDEYRDQSDSLELLSGFVQILGGYLCDCSSGCDELFGFASGFCLVCACCYCMFTLSAERHYPAIPTHDDVSKNLVHEYLPSDGHHEYIWFGGHVFSKTNWQCYGVEASITVLEDWYARNTNGEGATLD